LILLDTSALFAAIDGTEPMHQRVVSVLERETGPLVISPFVAAELDYLLTRELGTDFEIAFLRALAAREYDLASFDYAGVSEGILLIERYRDLRIGLADASIVRDRRPARAGPPRGRAPHLAVPRLRSSAP
jgi:predicted nucleic acid-binding protein